MVIDVSKYQGVIDWSKVAGSGVTGVILRSTVKNGSIDGYFEDNIKGYFNNYSENGLKDISIYKFSYERDYIPAYLECCKALNEVSRYCDLNVFNHFFLDLEKHSGRDYTTAECDNVIKAYKDACKEYDVTLGLYFNYNYAKNIVDDYWSYLPLWIARYNSVLGDTGNWTPFLWQYSSKGTVDGINGNVDVNKYV